jgi:hypothetical protein
MAILEHFALKQLYLCDAASANEHIFYTITDVQMYNFTIVAGIGKYRICLYIKIHHMCMRSQAPISFLFPITLCRNL